MKTVYSGKGYFRHYKRNVSDIKAVSTLFKYITKYHGYRQFNYTAISPSLTVLQYNVVAVNISIIQEFDYFINISN